MGKHPQQNHGGSRYRDRHMGEGSLREQGEGGEARWHDQCERHRPGSWWETGQRTAEKEVGESKQHCRHCQSSAAKSPSQDKEKQRQNLCQYIGDSPVWPKKSGQADQPGRQNRHPSGDYCDRAGTPHCFIVEEAEEQWGGGARKKGGRETGRISFCAKHGGRYLDPLVDGIPG